MFQSFSVASGIIVQVSLYVVELPKRQYFPAAHLAHYLFGPVAVGVYVFIYVVFVQYAVGQGSVCCMVVCPFCCLFVFAMA